MNHIGRGQPNRRESYTLILRKRTLALLGVAALALAGCGAPELSAPGRTTSSPAPLATAGGGTTASPTSASSSSPAASPTTGFSSNSPTATSTPAAISAPKASPSSPAPNAVLANTADGTQAAQVQGWGPVTGGDEFNYSGAPDSTKWSVYNSVGHAGNGLRSPQAISVNNGMMTISGNSAGTTGGMSAKFSRGQYGRYEVRMKTSANEPQYHAVAILWPDAASATCAEVDFAEQTEDLADINFFLHYGCAKGVQTYAKKPLDMTQWHNYAVQVCPSGITGYVDGQPWFKDADPAHQPNQSMHQTLQLDWFPVSGQTTKPATMNVDWVRDYSITGTC